METQDNLQQVDSQSLFRNRAQDFTNETSTLDLDGLKLILKKLNFLSFQIDPYDLDVIKQEEQSLIDEFKLNDFLENPFEFTNILLKMIDTTELLINKKYQ